MRVDCKHNQIQLVQHRIRQVELPIGQDVYFRPAEYADTVELLAHLTDRCDMLAKRLGGQPVSDARRLGMIRDGDILKALRLGSRCARCKISLTLPYEQK
jgi:hypothetical protein